MPATLPDFFDRYAAAFNRLDAEAIAALYHAPCAIVQDGAWHGFDSPAAMAANMAKLCAQYCEQGFTETRFTLAQLLPQGERHAFADVDWTVHRRDGLPPWRFRTSYNLIRVGEDWRIALCTAYQEVAARTAPASHSPDNEGAR